MPRKATNEKDVVFGLRMKALRLEKTVSQAQVGAVIDVQRATISKYERGQVGDIPSRSIRKLAKYFGVHPLYLMGMVDDRNWQPSPKDLTNPEFDHIKKYRACDDDGKKHVDYVLDREYSRARKPEPLRLVNSIREPEAEYVKRPLGLYEERAAAGLGNYLTGNSYTIVEFPENIIPPKADFALRIDGDSMEPEIPDGSIVFVRSCPAIESGQIGIFSLNGGATCKRLEVNRETQTVTLLSNNPERKPIEIADGDFLHTFGQVVGHTMWKGL